MSKHTLGPLELYQVGDSIECLCPADENGQSILTIVEEGFTKFAAVYNDADARRIVACWNACKGISTEDLERYYNTGGGIDEALQEASLRSHVLAVQQRDELLEALKEVLAAVRATSRTPSTVIEAERELDLIRAARRKACAAIAKATGCAN